MTFDLTARKIWVAGHRGMVGGAIVRRLKDEPSEVITADRQQLDLTAPRRRRMPSPFWQPYFQYCQ